MASIVVTKIATGTTDEQIVKFFSFCGKWVLLFTLYIAYLPLNRVKSSSFEQDTTHRTAYIEVSVLLLYNNLLTYTQFERGITFCSTACNSLTNTQNLLLVLHSYSTVVISKDPLLKYPLKKSQIPHQLRHQLRLLIRHHKQPRWK